MKKNYGRGKSGKPRATASPRLEIPSREDVLNLLKRAGGPLRIREIMRAAGVKEADRVDALERRIAAMERDGQLAQTRAGYGLAFNMELKPGRVSGHPDGFAFVVLDEGGNDVFLAERQARRVLHGDRVLVRITGTDRRGRPEGRVVEVLERANHEIVGRYFTEGNIGFVVPDNRRINQDVLIPIESAGDASHGQIVVATIVSQPDQHRQPIGSIKQVLGDHMAPGMEIDIAIRAHSLPYEWPEAVLDQAGNIPMALPQDEVARRIDLRDIAFVTIDGEDARDFDDAVFCRRETGGFRLFVSIADVAHYVTQGSPLDQEAYRRGTSVYFPNAVIPMLPEVLSNGLCSLNPHVDRFALVCEMVLTDAGVVKDAWFYEAVFRSRARLTYTEVAGLVDGTAPAPQSAITAVKDEVKVMHDLYRRMRRQREQRGALDIDAAEPRIIFDEQRKIAAIVPVYRNDAHKMIEEFMIAANVCAAEFLLGEKIGAPFRIHDKPDSEKVSALRLLLTDMKLRLAGGEIPPPGAFAKLLESVRGKPHARLIETVVLRTLKLAVYSPENNGHFGLAVEAYAHFTSPIRRYPDLMVHRAIKSALNGTQFDPYPYSATDLLNISEHSSMTERRADDATRDAINWLKCEFMEDKVGQRFRGVITSVTSFGLFVELDDIFVEGLVHVSTLGRDYFHYDPVGHCLVGERSKRTFQIAQRVEVYVSQVSLDDRRIDLDLA
ncbi:MAG: ribonuclease R [Gammaproteobacteria bacterium]|nr:ribonuclease R [Gammaproteobacteria bacterium]